MTSEFQSILDKSQHVPRFDEVQAHLHTSIDDIISFSGICKDYCVCIVDAVNSTKITASVTPEKVCRYYGVFLNAIATIAKDFGGTIVKNIGDSVLYYFPQTAEISNKLAFAAAIECGLQMLNLRHAINRKMHVYGLPPISFRVSADFGPIMKAKSQNSLTDDIFGATVNMCSKINSKTAPNTMSLGGDMYQLVRSLSGYRFAQIAEYCNGLKQNYPIYSVTKQI